MIITVEIEAGAGYPVPQITSPKNGTQFFTGSTITFTGTASDAAMSSNGLKKNPLSSGSDWPLGVSDCLLVHCGCWHWFLSYNSSNKNKNKKKKKFYYYREECRANRRMVYSGRVEPVPNVFSYT
jgi:Bacterial Ig domain